MNRLFVFLVALAVLSGTAATAQTPGTSRPVPALDEAFKRVDANQDGKLDPLEFERFIQRSRSLSGSNADEAIQSVLWRMPSGHYNTDLGWALNDFQNEYLDTLNQMREHPRWSVFWDKRHGVWRVAEDDPDSTLYAESQDVDVVIGYITAHS